MIKNPFLKIKEIINTKEDNNEEDFNELNSNNMNNMNNMNNINNTNNTKESKNINIKEIKEHLIKNYLEEIKAENKDKIHNIVMEFLKSKGYILENININSVFNSLLNDMYGYGILERYIKDDKITDIRVVSYDLIYIKKVGVWKKSKEKFENLNEYQNYIRYIVTRNSSVINYDTPIVTISDKKYRLRIEIGIEPVNIISPSMVIRKHKINNNSTIENLLKNNEILNEETYKVLSKIILTSSSFVISGKGGSGKTTLLRAMLNSYGDDKSMTINEETSEIYMTNRNVIQREVLLERNEKKQITLERLLKQSLVLSTDIIVIGEIKGSEAAIFLDAILTGHIGITTIHANSAEGVIDRLILLVKKSDNVKDYKEENIRQMLGQALKYIIHLENYSIKQIREISYLKTKKEIKYKNIYEKKE